MPLGAMPLTAPISPLANFITLKAKIFSKRFLAHFARNQIAQAGHVGIPLAGELIGLNVVVIFASACRTGNIRHSKACRRSWP